MRKRYFQQQFETRLRQNTVGFNYDNYYFVEYYRDWLIYHVEKSLTLTHITIATRQFRLNESIRIEFNKLMGYDNSIKNYTDGLIIKAEIDKRIYYNSKTSSNILLDTIKHRIDTLEKEIKKNCLLKNVDKVLQKYQTRDNPLIIAYKRDNKIIYHYLNEIRSIYITYIKSDTGIGSIPYFEVHLKNNKFLKISNNQIFQALPLVKQSRYNYSNINEVPDSNIHDFGYQLDEARNILHSFT